MALGKLPRIQRSIPIVDAGGRALDYFLRLLSEAFTMIERNEAAQDATLAAIQELQEVQAQQLILIKEAIELAGIAIGLAGGNTGTTSTVLTAMLGGAWVSGPVVNLTAVVVGDLTIPSTGLYSTSATRSFSGERTGELRLVEIVGGVDTIIGGPWVFTATRTDPNPAGVVYIGNPAEIPVFTSARTTIGAVGYRLDVRMIDGDLTDITAKLFVRRTV